MSRRCLAEAAMDVPWRGLPEALTLLGEGGSGGAGVLDEAIEHAAVEDDGAAARFDPDATELLQVAQAARGDLANRPDLRGEILPGGQHHHGSGVRRPQDEG